MSGPTKHGNPRGLQGGRAAALHPAQDMAGGCQGWRWVPGSTRLGDRLSRFCTPFSGLLSLASPGFCTHHAGIMTGPPRYKGEGPRSHPEASKEASGTRCSLSQPCSTNSAEVESQGSALSHLGGADRRSRAQTSTAGPRRTHHTVALQEGTGGGTGWRRVSQDLAQRMSCHGDELPHEPRWAATRPRC